MQKRKIIYQLWRDLYAVYVFLFVYVIAFLSPPTIPLIAVPIRTHHLWPLFSTFRLFSHFILIPFHFIFFSLYASFSSFWLLFVFVIRFWPWSFFFLVLFLCFMCHCVRVARCCSLSFSLYFSNNEENENDDYYYVIHGYSVSLHANILFTERLTLNEKEMNVFVVFFCSKSYSSVTSW